MSAWPKAPPPVFAQASASGPIPAAPVADDEFAERMACFAPFEAAPAIAVAVSGGRDSMCLALLAGRWAAAQGGDMVALTVDHGLRPEAAAEARQAGVWLQAHGIRHRVLRWRGPYPGSGIQAAARQARYRLLSDYCREHGILHLLVGHHRTDQAETVAIRGERASGSDGLAAMAAVSERAQIRVLRPLLDIPRARLTASLTAVGQQWIDDPSNDDAAMARGRLRSAGGDGALSAALMTAQASTGERIVAERAMAALAARALRFHRAGSAVLDRGALRDQPAAIVERLLARTVMAVGGRAYPPRSERVRRLYAAMMAADALPGRTLGGCRLVEQNRLIHVCREAARVGPPLPLIEGVSGLWDQRFAVTVTRDWGAETRLDALTERGWTRIVAAAPRLRHVPLPHPARIVMPAVWRRDEVVAVPHLGFVNQAESATSGGLRLLWRPRQAVSPAAFGKV